MINNMLHNFRKYINTFWINITFYQLFSMIFMILLWLFSVAFYEYFFKEILLPPSVENNTLDIATGDVLSKNDTVNIIQEHSIEDEENSFMDELIINSISTIIYTIQDKCLTCFRTMLALITSIPPMSEEIIPPSNDIVFNEVPMVETDKLRDVNTIYGPAQDGIQLYSDAQVDNIITSLRGDVSNLLGYETPSGTFFTVKQIIADLLHKQELLRNLFSDDIKEVYNVNYVINLLIQDAMIKYALTGDILYYHIAIGFMFEQIALLQNIDPLSLYEDPTIYEKMIIHFKDRFIFPIQQ